jgi:DNA polymerase III alpha subunit
MVSIMRHLIYCVDAWRQNGVVWGVGRGSSVCSFVLHLIGINRINPIEHGLDIGEWLK